MPPSSNLTKLNGTSRFEHLNLSTWVSSPKIASATVFGYPSAPASCLCLLFDLCYLVVTWGWWVYGGRFRLCKVPFLHSHQLFRIRIFPFSLRQKWKMISLLIKNKVDWSWKEQEPAHLMIGERGYRLLLEEPSRLPVPRNIDMENLILLPSSSARVICGLDRSFTVIYKLWNNSVNCGNNMCAIQYVVRNHIQGTIGCTSNSVPMVFIVFSRDSWGL